MNIENIRKIYTKNVNADILVAFSQNSYDIDKTTIRKKGQIKNQRFYCIKNGVAEYTLNNGKKIIATKGDILYFPPDITYKSKWTTDKNNSAVSIHFSLKINEEEITISDNVFKVLNDKNGYIITMLDDIYSNYVKNNFGSRIKNKSIIFEILYAISPNLYTSPIKSSKNVINDAIIKIENNIFASINVDDLASSYGLSSSSFRQKFKDATGYSPIKYKNYLLIKKAKALLASGEFTVSEVANELKFYDVYYFSRLFKQFTGVSPNKYRN